MQSIRGEGLEPDEVTDVDYEDALKAQDGVLFAQALERKALGRIRARFLNGAVDVGEKYYFDAERGIVRHRTREETGT